MQFETTILGYSAAVLTSLSFLPQVIKLIRFKNTQGISLLMYSFFSLGILLWLLYGILLKEWPIILANIFTLACSLIILFYKLRYR
jgi:MtN3 and saliva related transmembrane protein